MNALASFVGWLPFFVLTVIKVILFWIIKTDPLVFASLFISSFTDGFGILNRYFVGDIVAFFLLDFFVSSFVDFFPDDFASFVFWLLQGFLVTRKVVAVAILRGGRGNCGHSQKSQGKSLHVSLICVREMMLSWSRFRAFIPFLQVPNKVQSR